MITEILKEGCGIKLQNRAHFEDAKQDRTASCEMTRESQNFKIYKGTR